MAIEAPKPLGIKAYGSIGHLPNSRMGPADSHITEGQAKICCDKKRDKHDMVFVEEKLDGSCMAVAKVDGQVIALGRAGYLAESSPYEQHKMFAAWVKEREDTFKEILQEGERIVGEWLAQAHGTRYDLSKNFIRPGDPWVAFDIMKGHERLIRDEFWGRVKYYFNMPTVINHWFGNIMSVPDMLEAIKVSHHGAIDPVEGAVWRVERKGKVDFLAKYVRPDKVDGLYLPEVSGKSAIWNWRP